MSGLLAAVLSRKAILNNTMFETSQQVPVFSNKNLRRDAERLPLCAPTPQRLGQPNSFKSVCQ